MSRLKEGIGLDDTHVFYKKNMIDRKKKPVNRKTYRQIMNRFNQLLVKKVLDGSHCQLPHNMGYLRIVGTKLSLDALRLDFNNTKRFGTAIYHDNKDTDGNAYGWNWVRRSHIVPNMQHYNFVPTRGKGPHSLKGQLVKRLKNEKGYHKRFIVLKSSKEK